MSMDPKPARPRPNKECSRRHDAGGFTILELMVVLTILGLLAMVATPTYLRYLDSSKFGAAKVQIQSLGEAIDLFSYETGRYPSSDEGLAVLVSRPAGDAAWNGPYVKKAEMLVDPWGHPYQYRSPGQHGPYDLFSLGPKGQPGQDPDNRDLRSW